MSKECIDYPKDHVLKFDYMGSKIAKWKRNDKGRWRGRDCRKIEISFACDEHANLFFSRFQKYTKSALCPKSVRVSRELVAASLVQSCIADHSADHSSPPTPTRRRMLRSPHPTHSAPNPRDDRELDIPFASSCNAVYSTVQCYNIQTLRSKEWQLSELLKHSNTTLIALSEARGQHDPLVISKLQRFAPGYTLMNGRKTSNSGVCLLVRTSLIESHCKVQFLNDNSATKTHGNCVILRISPKRGRKIAFVAFYGKAPIRTAKDTQWSNFDQDIEAFCSGYEMYWLGDLNFRPGRARDSDEERLLERYGEKTVTWR